MMTQFFSQLEPLCAKWRGNYRYTKLVNTCPIDNFITLISLHINPIRSALICTTSVVPINPIRSALIGTTSVVP